LKEITQDVFPRTRDVGELKKIARQIRRDILIMLAQAGSGHTGGSLSAADIVTVLFYAVMRHNPRDPKWPERDRFVLSKGHAAPLLYAVLASHGYFPKEELSTLRRLGSRLQGHPHANKTPGVEVSTGSLGQGLAMGNGMALAARVMGKDYRVYVLLGDGESQEGEVWEAAMAASHYKLDNLCAILDNNGLQIDGSCDEIMSPSPFADKWRAFNWHVIEVDGHSIGELLDAFDQAEKIKGQPTMILAHTINGKGVSFMENVVDYHGVAPTQEELARALAELRD